MNLLIRINHLSPPISLCSLFHGFLLRLMPTLNRWFHPTYTWLSCVSHIKHNLEKPISLQHMSLAWGGNQRREPGGNPQSLEETCKLHTHKSEVGFEPTLPELWGRHANHYATMRPPPSYSNNKYYKSLSYLWKLNNHIRVYLTANWLNPVHGHVHPDSAAIMCSKCVLYGYLYYLILTYL